MDKKLFHIKLNELKETNPDSINLIEDIQNEFELNIEPITDSEKRALKTYPVQFIKRIKLNDGEWTTQLHMWAENGVKDLLDIDPLMLTTKNSYGDTVLMSLINAALGKFTEVIDYDFIKKILNTDFSYEERIKTPEKECVIEKNAIDEKDINDQSIIDCLVDFAYGTGIYDKKEQDPALQQILNEFAYPENISNTETNTTIVNPNSENNTVPAETTIPDTQPNLSVPDNSSNEPNTNEKETKNQDQTTEPIVKSDEDQKLKHVTE